MTNTISFLVSNVVKTLSVSASLTLLLNNNQLANSMTIVDTLEDIGANGTVVNSRTIGDVEVNISTRNNRDLFANTYFDNSIQDIYKLLIILLLGFGLTTIDLLEAGVTSNNFLTLSVFDASNNLIDSQTRTGPQGPTGLDLDWFISSENANIFSAILSGNVVANTAGYGIDDLVVGADDSTESIPESSNLIGIVFVTLLGLASWTYSGRDK